MHTICKHTFIAFTYFEVMHANAGDVHALHGRHRVGLDGLRVRCELA